MFALHPGIGDYYDFVTNEFYAASIDENGVHRKAVWYTRRYRVVVTRCDRRSNKYTVKIVGLPAERGTFTWKLGSYIIINKDRL